LEDEALFSSPTACERTTLSFFRLAVSIAFLGALLVVPTRLPSLNSFNATTEQQQQLVGLSISFLVCSVLLSVYGCARYFVAQHEMMGGRLATSRKAFIWIGLALYMAIFILFLLLLAFSR
jgi:uncharacterized membrane protein YidH (DUF202 family)